MRVRRLQQHLADDQWEDHGYCQHPQAAQLAGFPDGRVISIGHYWERRRVMGWLPFWFLFVGFVGQLLYLGVIKGSNVILDATTLQVSGRQMAFSQTLERFYLGYKVQPRQHHARPPTF